MRPRRSLLLAIALAGCGGASAPAADAPPAVDAPSPPTAHELDPTFGTGGIVTSAVADVPGAAILQPDGGVVVTGYTFATSTTALYRFTADGALDPTFGTDGVAALPAFGGGGASLAAAPDGSFYAVGACTAGVCVEKHRADGAVDTSYGAAGVASFPMAAQDCCITAGAVDGEGRLVAAAGVTTAQTRVARFTPSGVLDATYGAGGVAEISSAGLRGLALLPDGSAVVAALAYGGDRARVVRIHVDGALDTGFDRDVPSLVPWAGVAVRDDGGVFVGGNEPGVPGPYVAAAFDADGQPDAAFGVDGVARPDLGADVDPSFGTVGYLYSAAVVRGDLLLAGNRYAPPAAVLAQLAPDGALRILSPLHPDGAGTPFWMVVLVQPDERIVLVGTTDAAGGVQHLLLARYVLVP